LVKELKEIRLPTLPEKTITNKTDLVFLEKRKKDLEQYVKECVENKKITANPVFQYFVREDFTIGQDTKTMSQQCSVQ